MKCLVYLFCIKVNDAVYANSLVDLYFTIRDCNPGYIFSIPISGIEESVIP